MPVLPAAILSLLDLVNAAPAAPDTSSGNAGGDSGFQSLLNISSAQAPASQPSGIAPQPDNSGNDNAAPAPQPTGTHQVQLPTAVFTAAKSGHGITRVAQPRSQQQNDTQNQVNAQANAAPVKTAVPQNQSTDQAAQDAAVPVMASGNGKAAGSAQDAPADKNKKTGNGDDVVATLMNILQIVQALIPAATGDAQAQHVTTDVAATDTAAPATPGASPQPTLADLLAALQAQAQNGNATPADQNLLSALQSLMPAAAGASGDATAPAATATDATATDATAPVQTPAALLQDMQSLLGQLQQLLPQNTGATTATVATTTASTVTANDVATTAAANADTDSTAAATIDTAAAQPILDALTKDLKALLPQLTAKAPAASSATPTAADTSSAGNASQSSVTDLLKNTADLITQVLAKAAPQAHAAVQPAQTPAQPVVLPQASLLPQPAAAKPAQTKNSDDATPVTPVISNTAPQAQPTAPAPVNNAGFAPTFAQATIADTSGSNTNADTGGNNSNSQQQPAAIANVGNAAPANAASATGSTFARVMNQVSQGSVMDQVTFSVKNAVSDGSSKIHIQLDPESLGKLDIKLSVGADGKTSVVVTADNKNTLELLQKDSAGLTRALTDAGLQTDGNSLNFNLRHGQQEQQQNQQAAQTYQKAAPEDDPVDTAATVITKSYVVNLNQGLDIRI